MLVWSGGSVGGGDDCTGEGIRVLKKEEEREESEGKVEESKVNVVLKGEGRLWVEEGGEERR